MSSQAAFFRVLYQNDMLFQLHESKPEASHMVAESHEPSAERPVAAPVVSVPVVQAAKPVETPAAVLHSTPPAQNFPALIHKILILADEPKQKELLAPELTFLDNILKAVKHSANQADIINFSYLSGTDARSVLAEKRTNYFITFGVPLIKLQLDLLLIPYTPKLVEGIWFLLTDPLVVIEADRDLKRKLWQALQKMFENA
jgi:hypothetical protein